MEKLNDEQVIDKILSVKNLKLKKRDILDVREHQGGLVNYVFKITTKDSVFFLKQFLQELKSDVFKNLGIGPKDRISLSYNVENLFENIIGRESHIIPQILDYNEKEGYMIIEGFKNVHSLIDEIKIGKFVEKPILDLVKFIAKVHQETFNNLSNDKTFHNQEWLGLKLRFQYYEMAKLISEKNSRKLTEFTKKYEKTKKVLTHGDFCSINILLGENNSVHLIDFEDAHLGSPAFDLGYLLSEYFIAMINYPNSKLDIINFINKILEDYFSVFTKQDRLEVERETNIHLASMILYRTFGLSKNTFTDYIKSDTVKKKIKEKSEFIIKNSDERLSYFLN